MRGSRIGRAAGRDRRNVLQDRRSGIPSADFAGDRGHDHAVAVREEHMAVDPRLGVGGSSAGLELAGRQHHLLIGAVELIAIDIHVMELVVGSDLLQLSVRIHQRLPVPQANIVDGRPVGLERTGA